MRQDLISKVAGLACYTQIVAEGATQTALSYVIEEISNDPEFDLGRRNDELYKALAQLHDGKLSIADIARVVSAMNGVCDPTGYKTLAACYRALSTYIGRSESQRKSDADMADYYDKLLAQRAG